MGRAPCCDKANVKKGPWSPDEDATLKSYIQIHGTGGNWIALPQKIGLKRCGKSCRLRWLNYLRPNIKHGGFTEAEDNLICSLYVSIGSRWSIIAAQLPGRTDNDIKNYWNTKLKKKLFGKQRREQQARRSKESFSLYPPLQQPAPPPFLAGFRPTSNSSLIMPQIEAGFCYDHHANNQGKIFEADQYHEMCKDDVRIDFPPLDGVYGSMPQPLDGLDADGFTAVDVANSSTISSSSLENSSWGGISSMVANYEVYQQEMPQYYCTLFDEPRLLGYSQ